MKSPEPPKRARISLDGLPEPGTHDYVFADYRQVPPEELDRAQERARQRAEQPR